MDQPTDTALVQQAKTGDKQAFAELYNRWFDAVYDFAARMMRDRDEAEEVARDTFLKAMNTMGGLQKDGSFKSWIFAIAHYTALNRIEEAGPIRPPFFAATGDAEVSMTVVDNDRLGSPAEADAANTVATLVWEAAAALDPRQLSLLDLHLRQGLGSEEIAHVLGLSKNNSFVMLIRLKKAAEDAIGAFITMRDGRRCCGELDRLLAGEDVEGMPPASRKLLDAHVKRCEVCAERQKQLVSPLLVFGAFAMVATAPGVKAHVLEGLMKHWPASALGAGVGYPPPPGAGAVDAFSDEADHGPTLTRRGRAAAMLGGAAALFLFGIFLFPVLGSGDDDDSAATDDGGGTAGVPGAGMNTATKTTGVTASPSPTNTAPATATSTTGRATATAGLAGPTAPITPGPATSTPTTPATPTSTATAPPTTTATPTTTSTPQPCQASLSTNVGMLNIAAGGSSSFLLLASCNSTTFAVSGGHGWASAAPADGTVAFGAGKTIAVSVDATGLGEGPHSTTLFVQGEHNSTSVTVNTTVTGGAPSIAHFSVSCAGGQAAFTAEVTDDYGVESASVNYTVNPGDAARSVSLVPSGGNTWSASVDFPGEGGPYTIPSATLTARDGAGNTDTVLAAC